MAKTAVYRIIRVVDFVNKIHADVCEDGNLSILMAARQELERTDYSDAIALRDAAFALAAMVESRLLELAPDMETRNSYGTPGGCETHNVVGCARCAVVVVDEGGR